MFIISIDDIPENNILGVVGPVLGETEGFGGIRAETPSYCLTYEVLLSEIHGHDDGVVEEKENEGAGPEELVVQINVEPATDKTSLRILNHQISKHQALVW